MRSEIKKQIRVFGIFLLMIVLGFVLLCINVSRYNSQERTIIISPDDTQEYWESKDVRVTITPRGGSTDTWIKRIYVKDENGLEKEVQYAGIIYDVMVINQTKMIVRDWKLKIEIPSECYLNNAWCGKLEIHQNVNKQERYQTIDLRKYIEDNTEIILQHKVEGTDLMIPVYEGDYFVYLPSVKDEEDFIRQSEPEESNYTNKRVDFISYHLTQGEDTTPMEFTQAEFTYRMEKDILQMPQMLVIVIAFGLWCVAVIVVIAVDIKSKKMLVQEKRNAKIIEQAMNAFMGFIDAKDSSTNGHSLRVAQYSKMIAQRLGFSEEECQRIYYIGLMHDCGKIGIPETILKKTDRLSEEEYEIMKKHTIIGEQILRDFTSIAGIKDGVRYHHERFDGKGYPDGLSGERIPLIARIICVADSFDAMSSIRCYPNRLPKEDVIEQLVSNKGKQFDAKIVDCFLEILNEGTIQF